MVTKNEKKILLFIKYAPVVFILIFSLVFTLIITKYINEESKHDISRIKDLYVNSHNQKIKEKVNNMYKYILHEENNALDKLKKNIKEKVYEAHNIAIKIYQQNKDIKSKQEIIELIKFYFNDIRFNDGRGYIFIEDINGKKILQPINKKLEGKNLLNFKDINGYQFVKTIVDTIKNKTEKFDEYYWNKNDDTSKAYKKISFYKYFEPYDFAIGTGEYIDDFKNNLKNQILSFNDSLDSLNNEYIFILDYKGNILSHKDTSLIGKNILDFKGKKNLEIFRNFKMIKNYEESYIHYHFPLKGKNTKLKTSYIKKLPKWKWIIGSGYNDEELESLILKEKDAVNKIKNDRYFLILSGSTIITIFLMLISLYLTRILENRFVKYKKTIKETEEEKIKELIKNAKIYEDLFEANKSKILLIDPKNGEILNANKSAVDFYGYTKDKLLSLNISAINTLTINEIKIEIDYAKREKREYYNFVHKLANGEKKHVEVLTSPSIFNGIEVLFSIINDSTYRYEMNNKLLKTELEFKSLFEFSNIGLSIRDTSGNITQINEKLINMLGYSKNELLNKPNTLLSPEGKNLDENSMFLKLTKKEIYNYSIEKTYLRKDGTTFESLLSVASFINLDGEITHILSSVIDISEMKRKDNLLFQQSKMAAMGEMIGNIAHQWKQPLSTISVVSSGIKMQLEYGQLKEDMIISSMDDIQNSVGYLSHTIDDFRNFFKPNKAKSYFHIDDLINKTIKLISAKLKVEEITVVFEVSSLKIKTLENELIQVIMNILKNSIDAFNDKQISKLIFIKTLQIKDNLLIVINDNAGGIPQNILDRIFEPYFTTKHKSQGTGIGLYMTEEMVVKHMNGSIVASNTKYKYNGSNYLGAEFVITLPMKTNKDLEKEIL
jgi:PAS domain S-box-containing protein